MTRRHPTRPRTGRVALALGATVAGLCLTACGSDSEQSAPTVVTVPGDAATITEAVDRVAPGGLVLVSPGTYDESVTIDKPDVTLRGTDRNSVVIDGQGQRAYGVVGIADGIRVENLTVTGHTFYGVLITGMHDGSGPQANNGDSYTEFDPDQFPPVERFSIDHVTAYNNGLYGLYAFDAHDGVITNSYASGSADSGIYVGQCKDCGIVVSGNIAERNAVGFENANASAPLTVTGNRFSDNRVGMTLLSNYQEAFRPQSGNVVAGNVISDNHFADSPAQADGGWGTGIGIAGGTNNTFVANRVTGNPRAGLIVANTEDLAAFGNSLRGTVWGDNGVDVANVSADRAPARLLCIDTAFSAMPIGLLARIACTIDRPLPAVPAEEVDALDRAPKGVSFLDVAPPPDQPSMPADETVPAPLPDSVEQPSTDGLRAPAASLLNRWTWRG